MAEYEFSTETEQTISIRTTHGRLKFRTDMATAKKTVCRNERHELGSTRSPHTTDHN